MRQSLATYAAEAAERGIVVLPAMAFYGGLADLLAGHACRGLRCVDEILVGVALSLAVGLLGPALKWRYPEVWRASESFVWMAGVALLSLAVAAGACQAWKQRVAGCSRPRRPPYAAAIVSASWSNRRCTLAIAACTSSIWSSSLVCSA